MNHTGTITIETERLILRKFKLEDADEMFNNYTSHTSVTEFLTWKTHQNLDETKKYLQEIVLPQYNSNEKYIWAIVLKDIDQVIGCIDARVDEKNLRADLGWVIGDKFWGQGFMPEAARAVIRHLFKVGCKRIQAVHHHKNGKSGRVMQKVGMKHEGVLRNYHIDKNGNPVDVEMYAIIDTDEIL